MRNAKKYFFHCFFLNYTLKNVYTLWHYTKHPNSLGTRWEAKQLASKIQIYRQINTPPPEILLITFREHNSVHLDWLELWPGQKWQTMRDKVYVCMWPYCTDLIAGCTLKRNNSVLPPNSDYLSDQTLNLGFIQLTLGIQKDKNKLKKWEETVQVASCAVCITSTCCGVISVIYNQQKCVIVC